MVSEIGRNPVYELEFDGRRLALVHPGVGAPLAAAFLEEMIARGCRTFVACGGAGVLVPDVALGHVVVPTAAIRDEGTSYHYLPAAREVEPTRQAVDAIVATLERHHVPYVTGKTWTTDGLYRETRGKVERRVAEGCLTVEMEAAAFFAVAAFRGVSFGQLLYAGDDLSGDAWDERGWDEHVGTRVAVPPGRRGVPVAPGRLTSARPVSSAMSTTNLVTPADVGKRVTFQFELPNGYLSEAVGVFERCDEGAETYFVRRKTGEVVRVPARGVRLGKVVEAMPRVPP